MEMHLLKVDKIEISSFQTLRLKSRSNFRVSCLRGSAVSFLINSLSLSSEESVLFIGTRFSNLYTALVDTPA